jgi:hypothetical protein
MFRTEKPVTYPKDPDEITWNYGGGKELRDPLLITLKGERKILLVNKRNQEISVTIPGVAGSKMDFVNQTTGPNPPSSLDLKAASLTLRPQTVAVVTLAR